MSTMILVGFYKGIPKEIEEAAYVDGSGAIRTFAYVMLPIIKPAVATASIFTFLGTWNELMFANTLVDSSLYHPLPVGIM